jgi:hypothetical protein
MVHHRGNAKVKQQQKRKNKKIKNRLKIIARNIGRESVRGLGLGKTNVTILGRLVG